MSQLIHTLLRWIGRSALAGGTSKPVEHTQQTAPAPSAGINADMQRAIVRALSNANAAAGRPERDPGRGHPARPASRADRHALQRRGLSYRDSKIPRHYNPWVNNLRVSIPQQLQAPRFIPHQAAA